MLHVCHVGFDGNIHFELVWLTFSLGKFRTCLGIVWLQITSLGRSTLVITRTILWSLERMRLEMTTLLPNQLGLTDPEYRLEHHCTYFCISMFVMLLVFLCCASMVSADEPLAPPSQYQVE